VSVVFEHRTNAGHCEVVIYDHAGKAVLGGRGTLAFCREWAKEWLAERPGYTATIDGKPYKPRALRTRV
jgi:hypothetical protein